MSWSQAAFEAVAQLVGARAGLAFAAARRDSVELGIRRAMARARITDGAAYLRLVAMDAAAFDDLIAEVTVGETYFFREPDQFQFIRRDVLPEIRRRRGAQHVIRVWSAACASGEEPYSLAILFEQEGLGEQVHLLATDISRQALARARRGLYGAWSLRGPSAATALPFLTPAGGQYQLRDSIRRRVSFEHLNLALDAYPSFATTTWGMDLILCRNVLIYFDRDTVRNVARRLHDALAEGGWLITASSDPPLGEYAPLQTVVAEEGIFYRRQAAGSRQSFGNAEAPLASVESLVHAPDLRAAGWEPLSKPPPGGSEETAAPFASDPEAAPPLSEDAGGSLPQVALPAPAQDLQPPADPLDQARVALVRGDYDQVVTLTRNRPEDVVAVVLHVRALANLEPREAERVCAEAVARHAVTAELYYLHAVLLLDLGRHDEAVRAVRRVLYLDRSLAIAHFTLGSLLRRLGDTAGAGRAYRNARDLCKARPPDEVVPLSDGEHAGRLAEAADVQLTLLEPASRIPP